MAQRKAEVIRVLRVKKGDSLKTIYAKARRAFRVTDLQTFTEVEEGIPARQVLADLEAVDKEEGRKRKMLSR